jgi:hypothetical protein
MQRLIINSGTKTVLRSDSGEIPLVEFCEKKRLEQALPVGTLETMAGISHPGYYNIAKGLRLDGVKTLLLALDALGYEFVLREKDLA